MSYKPRIVDLGLEIQNLFGPLGPEDWLSGHHTAGPKDTSDQHCAALCRQYHTMHRGLGWGGIAYHFCISRRGTLFCLRPTGLKGAHVGRWNSNNLGVMFHGTTGDKPTKAQARTFRWLIRNAHTNRMPRGHRCDRKLGSATSGRRRGHNDWPGHESNACPGTHKRLIRTGIR